MDRDTRDTLIRVLTAQGWSQHQIAAQAGCSQSTVGNVQRAKPRPERICAWCGLVIPGSRRADAETCTPRCQRRRADARDRRMEQAAWREANAASLAIYDRNRHAARQAETLSHATNCYKQWTGPELEIAARDDLTVTEAALMLGRTWKAVRVMRSKLRTDPRKIQLAGLANTVSEAK